MLESIKQGISQYVKLSIFLHIPSGRKKLLLHSPWGKSPIWERRALPRMRVKTSFIRTNAPSCPREEEKMLLFSKFWDLIIPQVISCYLHELITLHSHLVERTLPNACLIFKEIGDTDFEAKQVNRVPFPGSE